MDSFIVSINAVLPLVILALTGFIIRRKKFVTEQTFKDTNKLCFKLFLPALLFYNAYNSGGDLVGNFKLVCYMCTCFIVGFLILSFVVPKIVKAPERQGVMIQGIFRGNFVLLGIPIATTICGEGNIGPAAIAAAIIVPLMNFLSVVTLSTHTKEAISVKKMVLNILKNPLIISSLLGLAMMLLKIPLPEFVLATVRDLGKVATPLSIVVLGGSLAFEQTSKNIKALVVGCICKLIVFPAFTVPIAIYLGFRGVPLVCVLVAFAAPSAVNTFIMAQQMGGDGELAGEMVLCSTVASAFTMFMWIFSLSYIGLI